MKFSRIFQQLLLCIVLLCQATTAFTQTNPPAASTPAASSNGFIIKKTTSNTTVPSGVNFSYTIDFTIPAGSSSVVLSDALPPGLLYQAHSFTAPCGAPPTVSVPAVGANGTVSLTWAAVPAGCTGSLSITVQFANGTTCNGTMVRNQACISGVVAGKDTKLCTEFVNTTATASNPWGIYKSVANTSGFSCSGTIVNETVQYTICVYKNVGTYGQLNLSNAVVTDVLPAGAVFVSTTCPTAMTYNSGTNTITWNLGNLSALPMYSSTCCSFVVKYPNASFPNGTTINNTAALTGTLGSPATPCGTVNQNSNTTSFQIVNVPKAAIYKWVTTTGQAGCAGQYNIYVCNNGGTTINPFTITDNLPAGLTGYTVAGHSANLAAPTISGGVLTANSVAALPPGGSASITINFTIPIATPAGTVINNCATLSSPSLPSPVQACTNFTVIAPAPVACVWKEVCSKKAAYLPGDVLTYRLRIQNVGGSAMTGTTVTDILPPYLQYLGSPIYYSANTWSLPCANPGIPSGATAWTGVTASQSGQTLTWNIPSIAAQCQTLFYPNCGLYGTGAVPYYYIEFQVKVRDDAPIGVVPNNFTLAGGNLPASVTSNIDYINVTGSSGFTLKKTVESPTSGLVSAGGTVTYKLEMLASGTTALWRTLFADLLPKDAPTDRRLLIPGSPRSSTADVTYQSTLTGKINAVSVSMLNFNDGIIPDGKLHPITRTGVTGSYFPSSVGTTPIPLTTAGIPVGAKNTGFYFDLNPVTSGQIAEVRFQAKVANTATNGDVACNSFAVNAAKRFLINSSVLQYITGTEQESNNACLKVEKSFVCDTLVKPVFDQKCCNYAVTVQNLSGSPITGIYYNVGLGSIQSASALGCTNTASIGATSGNFIFTPPCAGNPQLNFDANGSISGWVSIALTIIHQSGDTCRQQFRFRCKPELQERCDSISFKPFVYPGLNAAGRTYTVHNLKSPAAPICSIGINVGTLVGSTFTQLPWWLGGGMVLPNSIGVNGTALFNSIGGKYTALPSNQPSVNVPTGQAVKFNLGVDYTYISTGTVVTIITIVHCDGTICRDTIRWKSPQPCPGCPILAIDADKTAKLKTFAHQLALHGTGDKRAVKYVALKIPAKSDAEIFAVSAATADPDEAAKHNMANLSVSSQSLKSVLFEFAEPMVLRRDEASPLINVVLTKANSDLEYQYFDENGDELASGRLRLIDNTPSTTSEKTVRTSAIDLEVFPNPANETAQVRYTTPRSGKVSLELYNATGQLVKSISDEVQSAGEQQYTIQVQELASGPYFIRLSGEGFTAVKSLIVQKM